MARKRHQPKPEMPAPQAARLLLGNNLRRVRRRLEKSAEDSSNNKRHIHQLRVSTRRSIAVLDLIGKYLPRKTRRRMAVQLKKIRNSAGTARDLDVLIDRYQQGSKRDRSLLKKLKQKRKKAQASVDRMDKRIRNDQQFQNDCRKLVKALRKADDGKQPSYSQWARQKLNAGSREFFADRPDDTTSLSQLHRFRIAGKRFRYTLELLEPAFPRNAFKRVNPEVHQLQELLGQVNDHAVAVARIHHMQGKGQRIGQKVQEREVDALIKSRQKFSKWWTPERARRLKRELRAILATPAD